MRSDMFLKLESMGNMTTWKGMTMAATKIMNNVLDQVVLFLANTQAAMLAVYMTSTKLTTVIMSELLKDLK